MGMVYITATAILPQWFSTRRSLAVGLASSGAGLGGLVYNLLAGALIQSIGVGWTYRVMACGTLVINVLCSLLLKDRNKFVKPVQSWFNYREFGHVEVLLIVGWGFLTDIGYVVLLFSLPHYATSLGMSPTQGSIVGAMLSLGIAIGRPVIGHYSDHWGRVNMAGCMTALCGILCLAIWVPAKTFGVLILFAIPAGAVAGVFWGTCSAVTAEVVGLKRLPTVFGIICVALVTPTTFAEPIGLGIVSASGYLSSQVFVGCLYLVAACLVLLLRAWKISEVECKARAESNGSAVSHMERLPVFGWLKAKNVFVWRRV
jgi:MFS family permease